MPTLRSIEQEYANDASAASERDHFGSAWSAEEAIEMLRRVDKLHSELPEHPAAGRALVGKVYEVMHRLRPLAEGPTLTKAEATLPPPHFMRTPRWARLYWPELRNLRLSPLTIWSATRV